MKPPTLKLCRITFRRFIARKRFMAVTRRPAWQSGSPVTLDVDGLVLGRLAARLPGILARIRCSDGGRFRREVLQTSWGLQCFNGATTFQPWKYPGRRRSNQDRRLASMGPRLFSHGQGSHFSAFTDVEKSRFSRMLLTYYSTFRKKPFVCSNFLYAQTHHASPGKTDITSQSRRGRIAVLLQVYSCRSHASVCRIVRLLLGLIAAVYVHRPREPKELKEAYLACIPQLGI